MPPRASLTSSFPSSATDREANEVLCPLQNQDGSACRKRCIGEKRYRSMQEHIRRAHPEYYLPKLPATKESFDLMITQGPHERPPEDPNPHRPKSHHSQQQQRHQQPHHHQLQHTDPSGLSPAFHLDAGLNSSLEGYHAFGQHDGGYYTAGDAEAAAIYNSMQAQQRSSDEYRRGSLLPAASAAAALAQLHYHRPDSDWGGDNMQQSFYADQGSDLKQNHFSVDPALEDDAFLPDHGPFSVVPSADHPSLLPSGLARSPPERTNASSSLQRSLSRQHTRPRKSSLSQQARLAKHERKRSKDLAKRISGDRKAFGEPSAPYGKRWEDLIDAAASATEEEGSRDLTPIPASPYHSPQVQSRTSLPPFPLGSQFQSFQASPLNRALTPPQPDSGLDLQPFSTVDSSISSISHQHHNSVGSTGSQFHIMHPHVLNTPSESSPVFNPNNPAGPSAGHSSGTVQIYCAMCRMVHPPENLFACTNCICGVCRACKLVLDEQKRTARNPQCPKCKSEDSEYKLLQLDFR